MEIRVTGRHVDVSEEARNYIEEKAAKLQRFYDRIHWVEVVLDHESDQFSIEMIAHADRKQTFVASEAGTDTFAIVDSLLDKLERQLIKHKEKNRNHKHDGKSNLEL